MDAKPHTTRGVIVDATIALLAAFFIMINAQLAIGDVEPALLSIALTFITFGVALLAFFGLLRRWRVHRASRRDR